MRNKNLPDERPIKYEEWVCKKCGLLRTNKYVHIHGQNLPEKVLKMMRELDAKIKAKSEGEHPYPPGEGEVPEGNQDR